MYAAAEYPSTPQVWNQTEFTQDLDTIWYLLLSYHIQVEPLESSSLSKLLVREGLSKKGSVLSITVVNIIAIMTIAIITAVTIEIAMIFLFCIRI